jgi:hypothetical protein
MFTMIRKYRFDSSQRDRVTRAIEETFVGRLKEQQWFNGYYVVIEGDTLFSITVGDDRQGVENSAQMAADFIQEELSDVDIERLEATTGEVAVNAPAD